MSFDLPWSAYFKKIAVSFICMKNYCTHSPIQRTASTEMYEIIKTNIFIGMYIYIYNKMIEKGSMWEETYESCKTRRNSQW